jgi:tetratricopeptide (TPR) repeat protein
MALAYHKTKDYEQAQIIISRLIEKSDTTSVGYPAYFTGWYYSWIGEVDSAFYWLEKAYKNRSPEMTWLKVDPAFNNLKDDDRYWDLYERTGHKAYDDYMASKSK